MDHSYLKKQIIKIMTSYTNDEAPALSASDLSYLIAKIEHHASSSPNEALHHIIHDVVYEFITAYF